MDGFIKVVGLSLISVLLCLVLSRQNKDVALVLSLAACALAACVGFTYLSPLMDYFDTLSAAAGLDHEMFQILLKASGVGILAELSSLLCTDAGNSAIGKVIQLVGVMVILWMSLPFYESLLELITQAMEGI